MVQTAVYMPYLFQPLLWLSILQIVLSPSTGILDHALKGHGDCFSAKANFLGDPSAFIPVYVVSAIWQSAGWNSIIFIAALAAVDRQLYDAARVDGAGRLKRILHIDIPALRDTAVVILILRIGNIMSLGFEKTYLLQNNLNLGTSEIIATYVYKIGLTGTPQYSYSAAIGLLNSLVNLILLIAFNKISKRISGSGLW